MSDEQQSSSNPREALFQRVMGFAALLQGLAQRFIGLARFLTLSGLLAALVLDSLIVRSFDLSMVWAVIIGSLFMLPGLVIGWGWYILNEATTLPGRLLGWFNNAKAYAGDVSERAKAQVVEGIKKEGGLHDLKQLGGLAFDITSMGFDTSGLLSILGGSLSLTNPLVLVAMIIAGALVGLLDVAALLAGVISLFS
ncbi:MAG: hypothetical protein EBT06_11800 [Gammaproteobacteria bacterium]|nr:hypothetical protein [Gammaproteobacteria bacterium]NBT45573.1 hypothetical protein [Gammaproteobacteria bacterium]NBY21655.1 hypothetical protein [Gammaproteobacteria bacterium]